MTTGHVVHLLQRWGDEAPPADLRIGGAMSAGARAAFAVLLVVASLVACGLVVVLWANETPGWWFSLLFSVILVGLAVVLWAVYVAAIRTGTERALASTRWSESQGGLRQVAGTVLSRDVSTLEDGSVSRFELTVSGGVTGEWRPQRASSRGLLQTQVPGVGAAARVWLVPGAPAGHPVVIEVLDPSVVPGSDDVAKYAD
jgi:hypothetical protein